MNGISCCQCADDLCVIRSCWANGLNHVGSVSQMNTGSILGGRPSLGAWVHYGLGNENRNLPGFVVLLVVALHREIVKEKWIVAVVLLFFVAPTHHEFDRSGDIVGFEPAEFDDFELPVGPVELLEDRKSVV